MLTAPVDNSRRPRCSDAGARAIHSAGGAGSGAPIGRRL